MAAAVICLSGGARKRIWSLAVTLMSLQITSRFWIMARGVVAEVGVLWNSTLDYFYIDADDLELDSLLPAGRYSLRVFKTADGVYSSSGSGEAVLTIGRLVFLHYGLGGPVLGTGAGRRGHLEQRLPVPSEDILTSRKSKSTRAKIWSN